MKKKSSNLKRKEKRVTPVRINNSNSTSFIQDPIVMVAEDCRGVKNYLPSFWPVPNLKARHFLITSTTFYSLLTNTDSKQIHFARVTKTTSPFILTCNIWLQEHAYILCLCLCLLFENRKSKPPVKLSFTKYNNILWKWIEINVWMMSYCKKALFKKFACINTVILSVSACILVQMHVWMCVLRGVKSTDL